MNRDREGDVVMNEDGREQQVDDDVVMGDATPLPAAFRLPTADEIDQAWRNFYNRFLPNNQNQQPAAQPVAQQPVHGQGQAHPLANQNQNQDEDEDQDEDDLGALVQDAPAGLVPPGAPVANAGAGAPPAALVPPGAPVIGGKRTKKRKPRRRNRNRRTSSSSRRVKGGKTRRGPNRRKSRTSRRKGRKTRRN
jgi:hypothetical protein